MAVYGDIPNPEIDIDEAVKSSTAKKFRDNPLAVTQGDPTALAAGEGVAIDFNGQTSIITDELDTDKILRPDGVGQAEWSASGLGMILVERIEVGANVTSVTFAGLNGNAHEVYKLIGRIRNNLVSSPIFDIRPNGSAASRATRRIIDGVLAVNTIDIQIIDTALPNSISEFECLIHAREVVQAQTLSRLFLGKSIEASNAGVLMRQVVDWGAQWLGVGNITSLVINSNIAGGIAQGSTFELFKFAQS